MATPLVMIIEDEVELCELIALQIEMADIEVIRCNSATEALDILKERSVPLVLTDLTMPQMNALEFIDIAKDIIKDLPTFYLMTGYLDHTEDEMKKQGVSKLFHKPEDMSTMITAVKDFFN